MGRQWYIDQESAYKYAEILKSMLAGNYTVDAGLFTDDNPYRTTSTGTTTDNGPVMVIPVFGVMMKSDSCFSYGTSTFSNLIASANAEDSIKSIVLHFDSPGGSVDGTEAFSNTIKASKKPIVAFAELIGSAAYWAASSSNEIILSGETAAAGSIGTMASLTDTRGFDSAVGIKEHIIFATRSTDKNRSITDAMDGKAQAFITEVLDPLNNVFIGAVEGNRSGKINVKNEDVLTGKIYFGSNAVKVGLADKIGTLDYAIKRSLQLAKTMPAATTDN